MGYLYYVVSVKVTVNMESGWANRRTELNIVEKGNEQT